MYLYGRVVCDLGVVREKNQQTPGFDNSQGHGRRERISNRWSLLSWWWDQHLGVLEVNYNYCAQRDKRKKKHV